DTDGADFVGQIVLGNPPGGIHKRLIIHDYHCTGLAGTIWAPFLPYKTDPKFVGPTRVGVPDKLQNSPMGRPKSTITWPGLGCRKIGYCPSCKPLNKSAGSAVSTL